MVLATCITVYGIEEPSENGDRNNDQKQDEEERPSKYPRRIECLLSSGPTLVYTSRRIDSPLMFADAINGRVGGSRRLGANTWKDSTVICEIG